MFRDLTVLDDSDVDDSPRSVSPSPPPFIQELSDAEFPSVKPKLILKPPKPTLLRLRMPQHHNGRAQARAKAPPRLAIFQSAKSKKRAPQPDLGGSRTTSWKKGIARAPKAEKSKARSRPRVQGRRKSLGERGSRH
jgi:hypothetical protein